MSRRIREHLRGNVVGYAALFLVLTGGTAQALDGNNTVFSNDIVNGEVKSADLAALGVTRPKIANNAVNSVKVLDGAVKTTDLGANAVTSDKVLDATLTGTDVADDTLGQTDIATSGVSSPEILNESLTTSDIQSNSIQSDEIENATVGLADIGPNAISAAELGDAIIDRPDPTPTAAPGGVAENGSYDIVTSSADCASGEELIGGYGRWVPDDNSGSNLEMFIAEVRLNHSSESVIVDGGNDSGADHSLVAVATCIKAES